MIVSYFFTIIAYILLVSILVLNFLAQKNYMKSKVIYINNPPPVCVYGDNLPSINQNSLNKCRDKKGNIIDNYYTYTVSGIKFVVTDKVQTFYYKICNIFCGKSGTNNTLLTNGNCKNPSKNYNTCIQLLEPPENCKNPEQALFTDFNNTPYFASDIFPSKSLNCFQD